MKLTNPFLNFEMLRLHKLIKTKSTGTPQELARKLNCSERTARYKIEALRDAGLPIAYCKTRGCYYYTEEVNLSVNLVLGNEEMHRITGGQKANFFNENRARQISCRMMTEICFVIREIQTRKTHL